MCWKCSLLDILREFMFEKNSTIVNTTCSDEAVNTQQKNIDNF